MRVLLTGAFGNVGVKTITELLTAGHSIRCFDLPTPSNRKTARQLGSRFEIVWGDITRAEQVCDAVAGCDAVIHDAAIIPPASELDPELTRRVNVEGSRNVIKACEAQETKPRLIFASSISLFGLTQDQSPPRRASDPVVPTDHYTHSKVTCEDMVRASSLDWVILRFSVVLPDKIKRTDGMTLESLFGADPACRVEYVHPADVGLAQTRALGCDAALGKVLLIGGGKQCQVFMRDILAVMLEAVGIGAFPDSNFKRESLYVDWLDTEESQRLLQFQRHDFAEFRAKMRREIRWLRLLIRPLRWPIRAYIRHNNPYASS